ncbi:MULTISPECIES: glycosyltransferase 87 family protein [unclassified Janibacter]|uniref:glycosyltransferase 87 family protein n=1 Tax=unclassified Janibacter TaxID=2649294 RepID=UPI003D04D676
MAEERRGDRLRPTLLVISFTLLLLVGWLGPSAAQPDLGDRGWAPPQLPWSLNSMQTTIVLAVGYIVGALALARGVAVATTGSLRWPAALGLGGLALLAAPYGTADHTNYAAYGQIALEGGDPWFERPALWQDGTDPVASEANYPWRWTPSVYGPVAVQAFRLAAALGDDNLRQVVWVWQVMVVLAWLAVRALLRRLVDDHHAVDLWWTLNPLVFGVAVLGAHVDILATVAVAVTVLLARNHPALAGVACGVAASTKITAGVVAVALVVAWIVLRRDRLPWRVARLAGTAGVIVVAAHLLASPYTFARIKAASSHISFATPWRLLIDAMGWDPESGWVGTWVSVGSAVVAIVLALMLWRLTDRAAPATVQGQTLRALFALMGAYILAAAYVLPWYDQLMWLALPAFALRGEVRWWLPDALTARALVLAVAYLPGRSRGMSESVEALTVGFRSDVAPWLVLALWVAIVVAFVRRISGEGLRPAPAP